MASVPNAAEILPKNNRPSSLHERYRQTDRLQTDGRQHIANVNLSSRSIKFRIYVARVRNSVYRGDLVCSPCSSWSIQ